MSLKIGILPFSWHCSRGFTPSVFALGKTLTMAGPVAFRCASTKKEAPVVPVSRPGVAFAKPLHGATGAPLQTSLASRIPSFPLSKELVPTLLPRAGVPQLSALFSFADALRTLKTSTQEELIYEAEPHRLYFIACFCAAFVFSVYALTFLENTGSNAVKLYKENPENLPHRENLALLAGRLGVTLVLFAIPAAFVFFFVQFPLRLVRRMYFLPGPVEHVRIVAHPLLPGRPSPVYTIPLENLTRHQKAKVWTGRGFYGTLDNNTFFFRLKEKGRMATWVVDRKGFFWVDGRVQDFLFGKESVREAEAGVSYDQKHGLAAQDLKRKKERLRKELGVGWQLKMQAQIMREDLLAVGKAVKGLGPKALLPQLPGAADTPLSPSTDADSALVTPHTTPAKPPSATPPSAKP